MHKTSILIISNRKELSIKYKKLIEALNQNVIYTNNLSHSLSVIQKQEVEFIIISDTIKEDLSEFVRKIRVLTYNAHPIIIAVSKSSELQDKIKVLEAGADDFLGEEISKQEFQMRFKAHLRRYIESSLNSVSHLFNKNITIKEIKKTIENNTNNAYFLIKIKNIDLYRKLHGEIAYEKVIQTLSAIVNSTLANEDYVGHIKDDEFILITDMFQAEKLASFLVFAFDNILNKFYSEDEYNDNFTIQTNDSVQEARASLMQINISIIEKNKNEKDYRNILNNLNQLMQLCENSKNSTYVIDRIKLNGKVSKQIKNKVLIIEFDEALAYLIKNVCELNNLEVKILNNIFDFKQEFIEYKPDIVVLDWGNDKVSQSLEIAKEVSKNNVKLIFSSSYLNKKEILKSGADLYIPKPYEIDDLIKWILKFLN